MEEDPPAPDARVELRWRGGETAALEHLEDYFFRTDAIGIDYVGATMTTDPAKSCMRDKACSKLSPWLAHGCVSPRFVYAEVKRYEVERRKAKSTYWIVHELIWRDFSRFAALKHGAEIFKIYGPDKLRPRLPRTARPRSLRRGGLRTRGLSLRHGSALARPQVPGMC